jgi:hypothetical protein
MSKIICKCGAEYEANDPFPNERVEECERCSKYARVSLAPTLIGDLGLRVLWAPPKKPSRLLS